VPGILDAGRCTRSPVKPGELLTLLPDGNVVATRAATSAGQADVHTGLTLRRADGHTG